MKELLEQMGKKPAGTSAFILGAVIAMTATTRVLDRMIEDRAQTSVQQGMNSGEYIPRKEVESRLTDLNEKVQIQNTDVINSIKTLSDQVKDQAEAINKLSDRIYDLGRQQSSRSQARRVRYTF